MKSISSLDEELNNLHVLEVGRSRTASGVHFFFLSFFGIIELKAGT